jgi:hypothetical protein
LARFGEEKVDEQRGRMGMPESSRIGAQNL